jgi:hypothetical protein
MRWRTEYVRGIGKRGEDFVIIPDMGRIFGTEGGRSTPSELEEGNRFMRLTLKVKLAAVFVTVVVLAAAGMLFGIVNLGEPQETYEGLIDNQIARIRFINQIDATAVRIDRDEKSAALSTDERRGEGSEDVDRGEQEEAR